MPNFLESLESRRLLSVSPVVATLYADEVKIKVDVATLKQVTTAALKTIAADFKAADLQVTDKAQLKALTKDLAKLIASETAQTTAAKIKINADVAKLEVLNTQLAKKPGNATLTAKLTAAETKLTTDAAAVLNGNGKNYGQLVQTDLNAIVADGGTVGADASSTLTSGQNASDAVSTAGNQAYSTDVAAIVTAVVGA